MAENPTHEQKHRAGLFDIRFIIGALIGLYGVILVLASFGTSDTQIDKSDGLNLNLWSGLGMIVVAIFFVVWTRLRPIVVPEETESADRPAGH